MTISELVIALQEQRQQHGDIEVRVHCHGCCCMHAHEIERMKLGGESDWADEKEILVIEV